MKQCVNIDRSILLFSNSSIQLHLHSLTGAAAVVATDNMETQPMGLDGIELFAEEMLNDSQPQVTGSPLIPLASGGSPGETGEEKKEGEPQEAQQQLIVLKRLSHSVSNSQ